MSIEERLDDMDTRLKRVEAGQDVRREQIAVILDGLSCQATDVARHAGNMAGPLADVKESLLSTIGTLSATVNAVEEVQKEQKAMQQGMTAMAQNLSRLSRQWKGETLH